jgi:hypothetical protein
MLPYANDEAVLVHIVEVGLCLHSSAIGYSQQDFEWEDDMIGNHRSCMGGTSFDRVHKQGAIHHI